MTNLIWDGDITDSFGKAHARHYFPFEADN